MVALPFLMLVFGGVKYVPQKMEVLCLFWALFFGGFEIPLHKAT